MKRKTQAWLLFFFSLTLFSYHSILWIYKYSPTKSTIGQLVTVSTNKVYYEIGEPILIFLTITNPTLLILSLEFDNCNRVDYEIRQNNQTLYQEQGQICPCWYTSMYILPLMTETLAINHTSFRYFLEGGKYQLNVTLVGYCSKTTQIFVGIKNQEVDQEVLGVFECFFVLGVVSIIIPMILGLSRSRENKIFRKKVLGSRLGTHLI